MKHAAESTDLQRSNLLIKQVFKFGQIYIFPYLPVMLPDMCLRMENTDVIHEKHTKKKEIETYYKVYIHVRRSYLQK